MPYTVIATTKPNEYTRARQLLERFGTVAPTDFFNVLHLTVEDIDRFIAAYLERATEDPRLHDCISSLRPIRRSFTYSDLADFEEKAKTVAMGFAERLEGLAFHVRMHRRGHKGEISSQVAERFLDRHLLAELERRGRPGRITFDEPDAILDVAKSNDADLIVMGHDRRSVLKSLIERSVAEKVERWADCPCLIFSRPRKDD